MSVAHAGATGKGDGSMTPDETRAIIHEFRATIDRLNLHATAILQKMEASLPEEEPRKPCKKGEFKRRMERRLGRKL